MIDTQLIKDKNPIDAVLIEMGYKLKREGRNYMRGVDANYDSLVVDLAKQTYSWNSKNEIGRDVIAWLENRNGFTFIEAVRWLCDRAGLPTNWDGRDAQQLAAERKKTDLLTTMAKYYAGLLMTNPKAKEYAAGRGWPEDVTQAAGLGFWDGRIDKLKEMAKSEEIDLTDPVFICLLNMPANCLVYSHYVGRRCVYLSARGIEDKVGDNGKVRKVHWNPPAASMGERLPYFNEPYRTTADHVVIVEGQADAVTLGSWGVAAVALAGVAASPDLAEMMARHGTIYLSMDDDQAGRAATAKLGDLFGPMARVVTWPGGKDANAWHVSGGTSTRALATMGGAPIYAQWLALEASQAPPLERDQARRRALDTISQLDKYELANRRKDLAESIGVKLGQFDSMIKAIQAEQKLANKSTGAPDGAIKYSAGGWTGSTLYEMIVKRDPGNGKVIGTAFLAKNGDGSIKEVEEITSGGRQVFPFPPELEMVAEEMVAFSPGIDGAYDGEAGLFNELIEFIHKYVDIDETFESLSALYILMSWLHDSFSVVPYLRFLGDYGSGKSRAMATVGSLCWRPISLVAASPAFIYRILDLFGNLTIMIDEFDMGDHSDYTAEMTKIINSGYKEGAYVGRVDKVEMPNGGSEMMPKAHPTFGPKIFAMRQPFPDAATNSRCLTKEMNGGHVRADVPVYIDTGDFQAEADKLRAKLLHFRLSKWQEKIEVDLQAGDRSLPARLRELTVAMRAIIHDDKLVDALDAFVMETNRQMMAERQETLTARVLEGILKAWYTPDFEAPMGHLRLQMKYVARQVNRIIDAQNEGDLDPVDPEDPGGRFVAKGAISARKVGHVVRHDLNLTVYADRKGNYIDWDLARIDALCKRYGMEEFKAELIEKEAARLAADDDETDETADQRPLF